VLWRRVVLVFGGISIVLIAAVAVAILFGTAAPPRPMQPRHLDRIDLPALSRYTARDGTELAYRAYPGDDRQVAILIHGSATESSVMHAIAKTLHGTGATVYALDLRGHGSSGRRGDIDYIGQLDDDLADFVATLWSTHSDSVFTLIGFSAGGAFTMRIAGGPYGTLFDRYLVIAPALPYPAPVMRPNAGGWAAPYLPRIVGLLILDQLGIHEFDGLEGIAFAIPPGNKDLTGAYSFRLLMNLANRDYLAALEHTKSPMTLLVGADDDQFYADRYAPALKPAKPDLSVEIVPGLGHLDMITQPTALAALRQAFEEMPEPGSRLGP
jgi:non-heme chloroperoxidase